MYNIHLSGNDTTWTGVVDYYMEAGWLHMMDTSRSWKHVYVPTNLGVEATYIPKETNPNAPF